MRLSTPFSLLPTLLFLDNVAFGIVIRIWSGKDSTAKIVIGLNSCVIRLCN